MYDECMKRILSQKKKEADLAKRTLMWVLHAKRPLKVVEIQHALAVNPESTIFDEESLPPSEILISLCAGIITIDHESDIIRLTHHTTKEYLEKISETHFPSAHATIATICIRYFSIIAEPRHLNRVQVDRFLEAYPFYGYAVQYWGMHAHDKPEQAIQSVILEFLNQESKLAFVTRVQEMLVNKYLWDLTRPLPKICLLASFDLVELLDSLFSEGEDMTVTDSRGSTGLHWAALKGHEASVRLFLKNRIINEANDRTGLPALLWTLYKLSTGFKGQVSRILFGPSLERDRYAQLRLQLIVLVSHSKF